MSTDTQEHSYQLTCTDARLAIAALQEFPYKMVAQTINKLTLQTLAYQNAPEEPSHE